MENQRNTRDPETIFKNHFSNLYNYFIVNELNRELKFICVFLNQAGYFFPIWVLT